MSCDDIKRNICCSPCYVNCTCPFGPTGATGPMGPTGPISPTSVLIGLQVQARQSPSAIINNLQEIPLDFTVSNAGLPNIRFNAITNDIILNSVGVYYIDWWVNIDDIQTTATEVSVSLISTSGTTVPVQVDSKASTLSLPTQISGNAVINATTVPVTLKFINTSGDSLQLGTPTIQFNVSIIKVI